MYRAGVAVTVRPTCLYTAVLDAVPGREIQILTKSEMQMEIRRGAATTDAIARNQNQTYHARQHRCDARAV